MASETKKTKEPVEAVTEVTIATEPVEPTAAPAADTHPEDTLDSLRAFVTDRYGETFEDDAGLLAFVRTKLDSAASGDSVIGEILADYPELYAVIQDLNDGKPFEVALAANVDVDSLKPLEGDDDYSAYEEARQTRLSRKQRADEHMARFESNREESRQIISDYFAEKTMDEAAGEAFANYIDTMIADYLDGKVTRDFLDVFYRGMHYNDDVEAAREAGAIDAKNARIDAERERRAAQTDGMPSPGSAIANPTSSMMLEEDDIFSEIGKNSRKNW